MARLFKLHYNVGDGEKIVIWTRATQNSEPLMHEMTNNGGIHTYTDTTGADFWYKYALITRDGTIAERHERHIGESDNLTIYDEWRSPQMAQDALRYEAFAAALFIPNENEKPFPKVKQGSLTITLDEPRIGADEAFCIISKQIINWNIENSFIMTRYMGNVWQYEIEASILMKEFEFKFGIWDTKNNCFKRYEDGQNHTIMFVSGETQMVNFNAFNYGNEWRAAGVAVPVFSLRTKKSRGCGEFLDIKPLADWCVAAGLRVIQLLPINDTTATFGWRDSYPYNAISTNALHPNYISLDRVFAYYGVRMPVLEKESGLFLNDINFSDYNRTRDWKRKNLKYVFEKAYDQIISDDKFNKWTELNKAWIYDYGVFTTLRDRYNTCNWHEWHDDAQYTKKIIAKYTAKNSDTYKEVLFKIFIQYHLELQLREAVDYAHSLGVAIKGDLPIGINPSSVEAWVEPELFNFGLQAGAPPDFFSRDGQNWGFPIYNWDKMAVDGFDWWARRLNRMQQFFDAFRIDHILGFFRIWSIPSDFKSGLMGIFSPALPYTADELKDKGFCHDPKFFSRPVETEDTLNRMFEEYAEEAKHELFRKMDDGLYRLKDEYFSRTAVDKWVTANVRQMSAERIKNNLSDILHNVLFVSVVDNEYHPRIMLTETRRFAMLSPNDQNILRAIHDDFFYSRHNEFWKTKAMEHLEGMLKKCKMLVCGEDLGMIPASVPVVMQRMQILSLELQRMPKENWQRYGDCSHFPYLSVCATSSHDISSLRGWWEENYEESAYYYNNVLHLGGEAPKVANASIITPIVAQHLNSPSMLCINPIQDYAGLIDEMPHLLPFEERINEPSDPNRKWCYRIPFNLDDMELHYQHLTHKVRNMLSEAGRLN
ncbi:MAG: 4-alpha-glucanotransferase [Bacteroidales bacterium]|nr:4-alpha-glucanotransferase [Bacteroidales bacterium]